MQQDDCQCELQEEEEEWQLWGAIQNCFVPKTTVE